MARNRPARLVHFDYRGFHRYHVRTSTWRGDPQLANPGIACITRSRLFLCAAPADFEIDAYCLMPDHAHVLLHGSAPDALLTDFVRDWKQGSAFAVRAQFGVKLWRPGYFDRVLREHEGLAHVARYILANPVRAGLVRDPRDYTWAWCFSPADT